MSTRDELLLSCYLLVVISITPIVLPELLSITKCYLWVVMSTIVKLLPQLLSLTKVLCLVCYLICYRSQKCYHWVVISTTVTLLPELLSVTKCYLFSTTSLLSRLLSITNMLSLVCYLDYSRVVISFVIDHKSIIFLRLQGVVTSLVIDNKSVIFGLLSSLHLSCYTSDHLTITTDSRACETWYGPH